MHESPTRLYEVRWLPKDCAMTAGGFPADQPRTVTPQDRNLTLAEARRQASRLSGSCLAYCVGIYWADRGEFVEGADAQYA